LGDVVVEVPGVGVESVVFGFEVSFVAGVLGVEGFGEVHVLVPFCCWVPGWRLLVSTVCPSHGCGGGWSGGMGGGSQWRVSGLWPLDARRV
jgi:hypothetical protein